MDEFSELIEGATNFTLNSLNELQGNAFNALATGASRISVMHLKMINLHLVALAVGVFSIFEANLQDKLDCENGFREARHVLINEGEAELEERFATYIDAINVLKHGRGRSYQSLISRTGDLPFRIKLDSQDFFFEGDVSEVNTLIDVDVDFVLACSSLVSEVSKVVYR